VVDRKRRRGWKCRGRKKKKEKKDETGKASSSSSSSSSSSTLPTANPISDHDNMELWTQIMKDVNRTLQYRDFFRQIPNKYSLGNVLYVWTRSYSEHRGYLQGMNELAAVIVCALSYDYQQMMEHENLYGIYSFFFFFYLKGDSLLKELINPAFMEHDVFALYSGYNCISTFFFYGILHKCDLYVYYTIALMKLIINFFDPAIPPRDVLENKLTTYHYNQGLYDSGLNASLYLKLHYIQHKLLKYFDLNIYAHFEKIGLQPQLYMLRWVRVLFCREFFVDQTIKLWDELFSSYSLIEFIEYICMAMIYNVYAFFFFYLYMYTCTNNIYISYVFVHVFVSISIE
ncbi:GTPase activator, partial [Reticulomyxa filosa]